MLLLNYLLSLICKRPFHTLNVNSFVVCLFILQKDFFLNMEMFLILMWPELSIFFFPPMVSVYVCVCELLKFFLILTSWK